MRIWTKGLGRRALAAVVTLMIGLFGVSAGAWAVGHGPIKENQLGSIHIYKFEHQANPVDQRPDLPFGETPNLSNPVKDVEFTFYRLKKDGEHVNLADPAAWEGLDSLQPGPNCTAPAGYELGDSWVGTTDENGYIEQHPRPIGVYLICETNAPNTVVDRAEDFILTLPLPHNNKWVYDVHAYPKNAVSDVAKTVENPDSLGLGSTVSFPVTVRVPQIGADDELSTFAIRDELDARLTPGSDAAVTVDGTAVDASYYSVDVTGQTVTVEFNAAGRAWLKTQGGKTVRAVIDAEVTSVGSGQIQNTATAYINTPATGDGITSDPVQTNWGNLLIQKNSASEPAAGLEGAVFEVYAAETPYAASCTDAVATGDPIAVQGETRFTSDANGRINIEGLFVSDSAQDPSNAANRCYVVREVQAPAGYVTPEGAAADFPVTVTIGQTSTDTPDVTVTNEQQSVPELPLTGSAGALIMTVAGLALVAVAGVLMMISRRRAAQN